MPRVLLLAALAVAPPTPGQIQLDELLARMAEKDQTRTSTLKNYSSVRRYALENKRFRTSAEITVRMIWRHPGDKSFEVLSEQGSATVRKRVLRKMIEAEIEAAARQTQSDTRIAPRNYVFTLAGTGLEQGRRCYLLDIAPKTRNKFLIRGRIWVDGEDFAIVRIEGSPAQSPSVFVRSTAFVHRYEKFGDHWLAVSNESKTEARFFGHTDVTIQYSGYQINDGVAQQAGAAP